jgi:hypothetical protein
MKLTRIFLIIFIFGLSNLFALNKTSYRMSALGSNLEGIIPDEYTDILANPARLATRDKNKTMYAKIGDQGSPIGVSLFTTNGYGFIVEGSEDIYREDNVYSDIQYSSDYNALRDTVNKFNSQQENLNLAILKGYQFNDKYSFGYAASIERTLSVYDSIQKNTTIDKDLINNTEIYRYETNNKDEKTSTEISAKITLAALKKISTKKEEDFLMHITVKQLETSNITNYQAFTDLDPDLDGKDNYGYNTSSPDYHNYFDNLKREQKPLPKVGIGFEYKLRENIKDNVKETTMFGVSWQPKKIEINNVQDGKDLSVLGTHITTTTYSYINKVTGDANVYTMFYSYGKAITKEKLLIAYALRGDVDYTKTDNSITKPLVQEETLNSEIYNAKIGVSVGMEYTAFSKLVFRLGISPYVNYNETNQKIITTTDNKVAATNKEFTQNSLFTAGFGFYPCETFGIDIYTTKDVLSLENARVQMKYIF